MNRQTERKKVLIVDDEEVFLFALTEGLRTYAEEFTVFTAANGQEAVQVLRRETIDLLVTDLQMPEMDGFELLAHVGKHHPKTPAIVMTAYGGGDVRERLKALGQSAPYVEKPVDLEVLAESILRVLRRPDAGFLTGINIPGFLQLMEIERKTVTVTVRAEGRIGRLFLHDGELVDANTQEAQGTEAALDIISWRNAEIEIQNACPERDRVIHSSLTGMLLEACRIHDEGARGTVNDTALDAVLGDPPPAVPSCQATQDEDPAPRLSPEIAQQLKQEPSVEGWLAVTPNGQVVEQSLDLEHDLGGLIAFLNALLTNNLGKQLGLRSFNAARLVLEDDRAMAVLPLDDVLLAVLCRDAAATEDLMVLTAGATFS